MAYRFVRSLAACIVLFVSATVVAQPSMTSISPSYGGVGSNSPGTWTITGSGFSTAPKATRFVDSNNIDLFSWVSCESATSCTGSGVWANRVAAGVIYDITVFALVNGVKSGSFAHFKYYGVPTVTSVVPNTATSSGIAPVTINGSGFTSGVSNPGMTSIYLQSNISDRASGCASTTQCTNFSAPSLSVGVKTGPNFISLRTPGGDASPIFTYTPALATPSISSVTPNFGSAQGGTAITILGSNFLTAANGTTFTFTTPGNSQTASGVVCSSTMSCTMTVPPGFGTASISASTTNATSFSGGSTPSPGSRFVYAGLMAGWPDGRRIVNQWNVTLNTSENGAAAQYTLALTTPPASPVSVALSATTNGGRRGSVAPASLNFTAANWYVPQLVTVTGENDSGIGGAAPPGTGNYGFSVNATASSADASYNGVVQQMNFVNSDNDAAGYFYSRNAQLVTTRDGGTAVVSIALLKAPAANVVLNFVSSHPLAGAVSPASMTFTPANWSAPQTLTITGLPDGAAGNVPYAILVTASTADGQYASLGHPPDIYVTNAISPPGSVTATAASSLSVAVSWPAVAGADGYEVMRSTGAGMSLIAWTAANTFNDFSVAANTGYMYKVRAISSDIAST